MFRALGEKMDPRPPEFDALGQREEIPLEEALRLRGMEITQRTAQEFSYDMPNVE